MSTRTRILVLIAIGGIFGLAVYAAVRPAPTLEPQYEEPWFKFDERCQTAYLDGGELSELLRHPHWIVRRDCLLFQFEMGNQNLTKELLKEVAHSDDHPLNRDLAKRLLEEGESTLEIQEIRYEREYHKTDPHFGGMIWYEVEEIVENTQLSPKGVWSALRHPHWIVRKATVVHQKLTPKQLELALQDKHPSVRATAQEKK